MTLNKIGKREKGRGKRGGKRGFTLIELLVVVAMLAVLMGAVTTSVSSARRRARIQKATNDVKVIHQAILAYENWNKGELKTMGSRGKAANGADATSGNLDFLIGKGTAKGAEGTSGGAGELPVLLMAQLQGGRLADPWGTTYRVTIVESAANFDHRTLTGTLNTGYWLPNFYRTSEGEK